MREPAWHSGRLSRAWPRPLPGLRQLDGPCRRCRRATGRSRLPAPCAAAGWRAGRTGCRAVPRCRPSSGSRSPMSSASRPSRAIWTAISACARLIGAVGSAPPSTRFSAGYRSDSSACSCGQTSRVSSSCTRRTRAIAPGSARVSRGRPQLVDVRPDRLVLSAEPPGEVRFGGRQPDLRARPAQGAQRVEYHRDVDGLLQQRAPHRGQQPGGRDAHRGQRHAHAGQHALHRDPPGAPGQRGHLAEAAELDRR